MINTQLPKSSIKSLLQAQGMQQATGWVKSESFCEEMSLLGFIPYTAFYSFFDLSIKGDINSLLFVTPLYVRFVNDSSILPIFSSISDANGKKYILNERLLADLLLDEMPESIARYYEKNRPVNGKTLLRLLTNKRWQRNDLFEKNEDGSIFYVGREKEWIMTRALNDWYCITNDFLCLCSYMNKVTGLPSYTVLRSEDALRILPKSDE